MLAEKELVGNEGPEKPLSEEPTFRALSSSTAVLAALFGMNLCVSVDSCFEDPRDGAGVLLP